MRKIFYTGLILFWGGLLFPACGGSAKRGPGSAAKQYVASLAGGDYDQFVAAIDSGAGFSKEGWNGWLEMWGDSIRGKGGLDGLEVVSEQFNEEGDRAKVVLRYVYGDETTEETSLNLVKKEDRWLIVLKR